MSAGERIRAGLELVRIGNLSMVGLSVLVGSGGMWPGGGFWRVALAMASAMLIAGGGNALNDVHDIEADRRNRPQRPLPSQRLSLNTARALGLILMSLGLASGFIVSLVGGLVATAVAGLLWLYAARGKKMGFFGNILVAAACGTAFVYGGLASGAIGISLYPAAFAFLMHLAREMVKDVQDLEGDTMVGARTTAMVWGRTRTLRTAAALLVFLILLTPWPYISRVYGLKYLIAVIGGVDIILGGLSHMLWRNPETADLPRISLFLKIEMLVGMMAVCLGVAP
jgi:geranylgeranylglycerol-phosphate geranylgeranyltransferase